MDDRTRIGQIDEAREKTKKTEAVLRVATEGMKAARKSHEAAVEELMDAIDDDGQEPLPFEGDQDEEG
ncbi:MAG: hypothetical protein GY719_10065 [bacterium]|nr:hypothetical protein [bacterium]